MYTKSIFIKLCNTLQNPVKNLINLDVNYNIGGIGTNNVIVKRSKKKSA